MNRLWAAYKPPITTPIYFPSEYIQNYTERWPEHVSVLESQAALIKNLFPATFFNPALDNSPQSALQEGSSHLKGSGGDIIGVF